MIVLGASVTIQRFGRPMQSTHMLSTIPGQKGRRELVRFAQKIGLLPHWLQRGGSEFEHFDVFGRAVERAKLAGAKIVARRDLMEVVWVKREARTGTKRRRAYALAKWRAIHSTQEESWRSV